MTSISRRVTLVQQVNDMNMLYSSDKDRQQQASEIHALAEQYQIQEEIVRTLYEKELQRFHSTAHIRQYLTLLTSRHVRELIRLGLIEPN